MAKEKEKKEYCSSDEEMLMWTSYRYCIGRHTYVTTLANYIGRTYYNRIRPERLEFTAKDIRKCVSDYLRMMLNNFSTNNIYGDDRDYMFEYLMKFVNDNNINTEEEFLSYARIDVSKKDGKIVYSTAKWKSSQNNAPSVNYGLGTAMNIDELIPWIELANYFDKDKYVDVVCTNDDIIKCYKGYMRKVVPVDGSEDLYAPASFGWEEVWRPVDSYGLNRYISPAFVKEVN